MPSVEQQDVSELAERIGLTAEIGAPADVIAVMKAFLEVARGPLKPAELDDTAKRLLQAWLTVEA